MTHDIDTVDPLQIAKAAKRDAREALMFATAAVIFSLVALGLEVMR